MLAVYKREHFVLYIWDIRPIPTIRTTVRKMLRPPLQLHIPVCMCMQSNW